MMPGARIGRFLVALVAIVLILSMLITTLPSPGA
jgi:hypothetical protein